MIASRIAEEPVVCITLDTDWCLPVGVEHALSVLDEYSLPATIFCTGEYDVPAPHEQGIHPTIDICKSRDAILEPVIEMKRLLPQAVGCRCHRLECNSFLYAGLPELGIAYDSSWPMILKTGIEPLRFSSGLVQLPIFYTEPDFLEHGLTVEFEDALMAPGLKVFLFHPGHVYHNTLPQTYDTLHAIPQAKRFRPELINKGFGVGRFFRHVLERVKEKGLPCLTCSEVVAGWTEDKGC